MRVRPVLLLALVAVGCSSSEYHSTQYNTSLQFTQVTQNISVAWGARGPADDVRFDDPRLRRAVQETAAIVGHRVDFRFDVTLMPRPMGAFFDGLFEHYIGRIPRDLERLRTRDADLFAFGRERLRAIHFDYDGSIRAPVLAFDAGTGVLRIQMNGMEELVSYGAVSEALDQAFRVYLRQTFQDVEVARVPAPQLRFYLRYLNDLYGNREVSAAVLVRAFALYDRVRRTPELRQATATMIVRRSDVLGYERRDHPAELAALPPSSPWHAAERGYARWIRQAWGELSDAQQRELFSDMVVFRGGAGRLDDPFVRDAYPGVDLMALTLGVVDRWISAGRPRPVRFADNDHAQRLFDFVVCPPRAHDERQYQQAQCQGAAYRYLTTDTARRAQFFDAVLTRQSTELTEALFANLAWLESPYLLEAYRRFENDDAQWTAASRVVADRVDYNRGYAMGELYDDMARVWRQHPPYRGTVLYVLAAMDYPRSPPGRTVNWDQFARIFGSLATRRDLDRYLSHGDAALVRISVIVPALAPGVDIASAITPHLDRTMADDRLRRRFNFFPYQVLSDLVDALRARRDNANLTALRRYFDARMAQHPSEQRMLETLVQRTNR